MKFDGLGEIGNVIKATLTKREGEHSCCVIELSPDKAPRINSFDSLVGAPVEITIASKLCMCGFVDKVESVCTYAKNRIFVTIFSNSVGLDEKENARIFQDDEKSLQNIVDTVLAGNIKGLVREKTEPLKEAYIQDYETDFAFLKRIAHEQGYRFFVDDTKREDTSICIGNLIDTVIKVEEAELVQMSFCTQKDKKVISLQLTAYCPLGSKICIDGFEYTIIAVKIEKENDEERYFYTCENVKTENTAGLGKTNIMLGLAKVVENKDSEHMGRIKVEYEKYEDALPGKRMWIPYLSILTEKDKGVVLIPAIEEQVEVLYSNGSCIAIGCNRRVALEEKLRRVENRSIAFNDKYLIYEKDAIRLSCGSSICSLNNDSFKITTNEVAMKNVSTTAINTKSFVIQSASDVEINTKIFNVG